MQDKIKYSIGKNPNSRNGFKKGHKGYISNFKDDKVSYSGLHKWINKKLGKANKCEFCEATDGKIEWANKSQKYLRDFNDWVSLCTPCHRGYDSNFRKIN